MGDSAASSGEFGTLLRTLARNLRSGTVRVRSGTREKLLVLEDGVVKDVYAQGSRFRIGDILYRARAIERSTLQQVLVEQKNSGLPLGEILIQRGEVSPRQLRDAMEYRLVEEVLEIYYWKDLRFEFLGVSPQQFMKDTRAPFVRIAAEMDAEELVRRIEKTVADIERFNEVTPSLRDVYELTEVAVDYLRATDLDVGLRDFLLLLDGRRDMKEVLREMRMNRFDVLEFFHTLRTEGKIRAKNGFELMMLAENQRKELEPQKLLRLYERVRELGVEGFAVNRNLADLCIQMGQPIRAARLHAEMARSALENGDSENASEAAHRALVLAPGDLPLRRSLIALLQKAGREEEGAEELRDLAVVLRDQGELAEAQKALLQAADVLNDPRTREDLAAVYLDREEFAQARRAFREAALLRAQAGEAESALRNLESAVEAEPEHLGARLELAEAYAHCDRETDALHSILDMAGQASRLRPEGDEPRDLLVRASDLAVLAGAAGCDALAACARALALIGDTGAGRRLWGAVADAHLGRGAFPEAVVALREVLALDPADEEARETLATTLTRAGDLVAAGSEWRELAEEREKAEDTEGAESAWASVLSVCPLDLEARRRRAKCAEALGRKQEAGIEFLALGDVLRVAGRDDEAIEAYRRSRTLCKTEARILGRLIAAFESMEMTESALEVRRALMGLERERENWAGLLRAAWDLRATRGEDDEIRDAIDLSLRGIEAERAAGAITVDAAESEAGSGF